jgi:hypothetical protein
MAIYELRTYNAGPRPDKRRELVDMMGKLMPVFAKAGIKVVGLWTTLIGQSGDFNYLLEYESLADREVKWTKFVQDPDLHRIIAEAGDGDYPSVTERNAILQPTPYSPLK